MISCSTGQHPRCQGQATSSSKHMLRVQSVYAALGLQPIIKPLFYLTTIGRQFLFASSLYYRSHTLPAPTRAADWQRERTNDSCQVKCGCSPYMIRALASVSQLCSHIVSVQFCISNFCSALFFVFKYYCFLLG